MKFAHEISFIVLWGFSLFSFGQLKLFSARNIKENWKLAILIPVNIKTDDIHFGQTREIIILS